MRRCPAAGTGRVVIRDRLTSPELVLRMRNVPAGSDHSPGQTILPVLGSQAGKAGTVTALARGDERWSYAQLGPARPALAGRLAARGIGPESIVAVLGHRTPRLIETVLGILRTGAAYLPLDPAYPVERIRYMLADADAALVVADSGLTGLLPAGIPVMRPGESAGESFAAPVPPRPDNLAYIIYTSGSTGRPKGVAVEHRALAALVNWGVEYFGPARLRAVLASTSLSFDISAFEIFVPLAAGGSVVIAQNLLELPDLPGAAGLTFVNTVPSVLAELVASAGLPAGIPCVGLAGEQLPWHLVRRLYDELGVGEVFNLYGPSETAIYSTAYPVPREHRGTSRSAGRWTASGSRSPSTGSCRSAEPAWPAATLTSLP